MLDKTADQDDGNILPIAGLLDNNDEMEALLDAKASIPPFGAKTSGETKEEYNVQATDLDAIAFLPDEIGLKDSLQKNLMIRLWKIIPSAIPANRAMLMALSGKMMLRM